MPDTETLTDTAPFNPVTYYSPAPETPPQERERERERIKYKDLYEEMMAQVDSLEESHRQLALELRAERERLASERTIVRVQVATIEALQDLIVILKLHASWQGFQAPAVPALNNAHPF